MVLGAGAAEDRSIHDGGDDEIVVGRVESLRAERAGRPLLFFRGRHEVDGAA